VHKCFFFFFLANFRNLANFIFFRKWNITWKKLWVLGICLAIFQKNKNKIKLATSRPNYFLGRHLQQQFCKDAKSPTNDSCHLMLINAGYPHQWTYLRNLSSKIIKKNKPRPVVHCESKGVIKAEEHIEDFVRKSWNKNFNCGRCWM